jgi:Putative DNA-binding domain
MRQAVAEFFFMAALTGRYTTSSETRFEFDLAQIRAIRTGEDYLGRLSEMANTVLTKDYWEITLPSALATSAARSPSLFGYQAALIKLDAPALYSPIKIASLVDPTITGTKSALEQHHLFPRGYLKALDITDTAHVNQIANFAPVEWPENIKIGSKPPADYVPALDAKLGGKEREEMYFWHALPHLWWELDYEAFLKERRVRMARVIKHAWAELSASSSAKIPSAPPPVELLIVGGETDSVEFKSTLRTNLHTGQSDDKIQLSALKTIAGFLNNNGGTLLIGVTDDGEVLGLKADNFPNEDKYGLHLVNLVLDRIGPIFLPYVHAHFKDQDDKRVPVVRCERGPRAPFVKDGALQRFYVRGGNSTAELQCPAITDYVKKRFD